MAEQPIKAVRIELYAPVASFRDPMFPGTTRCLPVPPLSTVRGMLAAATGRPTEPVPLGMCAHADGGGIDAETYHPIAADGSNPAIAGRVSAGKGGMTLRERPFLVGVHLTVWIPLPDGDRIAAALRRPVWGLRLGRSQDLVHIRSITRVTLYPADTAVVGHAVAPLGGHDAPNATSLRLAETITTDRLRTRYGTFLWCLQAAGQHRVHGAYRDQDQAVWLHSPPEQTRLDDPELAHVLAKSSSGSGLGRPELLTQHSLSVREAARAVADRIGSPGVLASRPGFWSAVETAALLHDAGKVAEGFQRQLRTNGEVWGERHEVLSLAYVDLLTRDLPEPDRLLVATGVAFHHKPLVADGRYSLIEGYADIADWERKFGRDPDPSPGRPRIQVPLARHHALLRWLADNLQVTPPQEERKLWELARDTFARLCDHWLDPVPDEVGLIAVLLQGAVTLADHSGSAHVPLQSHMPLPRGFITRLVSAYPHQKQAAEVSGNLVLTAPTGSGKTEAGLAWASRQLDDMPAQPRLVWVLPYRASIDAARKRFRGVLEAPPGEKHPDIGVVHATAARTLLTEAVADDRSPGADDARKAHSRAGAMRLFAQRIRVTTPYQLLRAAIAGPRYSSVLLEQANALFVLDELHAYEPDTFGRLCAAMRMWQRLGSRVAVLSATLAPPMLDLIADTLGPSVRFCRAEPGTAPDRHRLVIDDQPITTPSSLDRIRGWLMDGHSVLVVANTVATAQRLFTELAPTARQACPGDPDAAILLHSRFRADDRARIEQRILARHPERKAGEIHRRGGLVVATQVLEVSLCLDFDRGASELAPIEALAQRAGRVNRRGRHPEGIVEFRIHPVEDPRPYDPGALDAAMFALHQVPGPIISEETIESWLKVAYETSWGLQWLAEARHHRDDFERDFLTFTDPFVDRSEFARRLDEAFDSTDVLLATDVEEYKRRAFRLDGHPLLAAGLLIPIRYTQLARLKADNAARLDRDLRLWVIDVPYDDKNGLTLPAGSGGRLADVIVDEVL